MKSKATCFLTAVIGTVLVFSAASSFAATLYPFYLAGGLVRWSTPSADFEGSLQGLPADSSQATIQASSKDDGYRLGIGFSFNETWSVEASYINGPRQNVVIDNLIVDFLGNPFSLGISSKLDITVFRFNPVYEYPLFEPISVLAKVGIARIQAEATSVDTISPVVVGGQPLPGNAVSSDFNETKAFAAAGLKLNFLDGKIAVVASFVQYLDAMEGVDQALELDLFWRF